MEEKKAKILNQKIAKNATLLWNYKTDSLSNIDVSSDGKYIVVGDRDKRVRLFNQDGELLWSYETGGDISKVAISSNGSNTVAVSDDDNEIKVYFFNNGGELLWSYEPTDRPDEDILSDVIISADGSKIIVINSNDTVYFLNGDGGVDGIYKSDSIIKDHSVSADASYIAAGCHDKRVLFIDRAGELLWDYKISGWRNIFKEVRCVAVSPDASYIAVAVDGRKIQFLNWSGGLLGSHALGGILEDFEIRFISITSEGDIVTVIGNDTAKDYRQILFLNKEGEPLWTYEIDSEIRGLSVSKDGSNILIKNRKTVYLLSKSGILLWKYDTNSLINDFSISSDGNHVVVAALDTLYLFKYGEADREVPKKELEKEEIPKPEFTKSYITEKETITTKERKIPVFTSKELPTKCPSCGAVFKGKSGDTCEYCGSVIRMEEKVKRAE